MFYLWLQILLSLLAAAIVGALFSYWWIKRRYEDVTTYYESTLSQAQTSASGLTREDLNASLTSLKSSVATIQMPDIKPVHARLGVIENRLNEPVNEIRGLTQRMNDIDGSLAMLKLSISELRNADLDPMENKLASLSHLVETQGSPDLSPIAYRLQHIEEAIGALQARETDLGPIHSGLAQLEMSIAGINLPETDIRPIRDDIAGLESRISALQQRISEGRSAETEALSSELSGMHTSLASLTTSVSAAGATDFGPIHDRIDRLERSLESLMPEPVDFGTINQRLDILRSEVNTPDQALDGLHARLAGIENIVSAIDLGSLYHRMDTLDANLSTIRTSVQSGPNFAPLEQRIVGLHEAVRNMPEPDLSPVISSVHAIEGRLDLGALENRMTSIEYGLAALHHTLRTRIDGATDVTVTHSTAAAPPPPIWETPDTDDRDYNRDETDYSRTERKSSSGRDSSYRERTSRRDREDREPYNRGNRESRSERTYSRRDYSSRSSRNRSRERDTISAARRPGDKANLLTNAAFGTADELERISGVGPMLHDLLTGIGVYYFWQIAEWGPEEIEWVDNMLDGFNGRIERDNWVGQARIFADEPSTANRP